MGRDRAERRRKAKQGRQNDRNWLTWRNFGITSVLTAGAVVAAVAASSLTGNHDLSEPVYDPMVAEAATSISETVITEPTNSLDDRITFEHAQNDPSFRQPYIDQIVERIGIPDYVPKVIYTEDRQGITYAITEFTFDWDGERMKTEGPFLIKVLSYSFEGALGENEEGFNSAIRTNKDLISTIKHEYRHAEIVAKGLVDYAFELNDFINQDNSFNAPLFLDFMELDAITDEINSSGLSVTYGKDRLNQYLTKYTDMWNDGKGMYPDFVENLQREFFHDWILDMSALKERGGAMYLESPKGERFYLPGIVTEKAHQLRPVQ